jgi:adenosylcobinamide kinase/adenosylcobinamide-phosphate guanylyltransferase
LAGRINCQLCNNHCAAKVFHRNVRLMPLRQLADHRAGVVGSRMSDWYGSQAQMDSVIPDAAAQPPLRSLLIVGGARSGKSRYAQKLAEASGKTPVLIATATAGDAEMAERIEKHRAERSAHWHVVEEEIDLAGVLTREAGADRVLVVDCLTLWLSNLMCAAKDAEAAAQDLVESLTCLNGPAIFVSNEIGLGIVPGTGLGRAFRDAQGRLNQSLAAACQAVVFVASGLPLQLKPNAVALRL